MNLKFRNNIYELNLLNRIYRSIPEEIEFNLKELIGVEKLIYIRPAGRYIAHERDGMGFAFRLLPDGEFVFFRFPFLFLRDFFESIFEREFSLTPMTIAFAEYILIKFISLHGYSDIFKNLRFCGLIDDRFESEASNYFNLILAVDFSKRRHFVSIELSEKTAKRIVALLEYEKEETLPDIQIYIIPVIAEGDIALEELRSIDYGNWIVFKNPFLRILDNGKKGGIIMLRTEDGEIAGEYDLEKNEFRGSENQPIQGTGDGEKPGNNIEQVINNIHVTLYVELERIKMKISELKKVIPGYLMELNKREIEEVSISANGKIIAKGRLIYDGDTLCVEITSIGG